MLPCQTILDFWFGQHEDQMKIIETQSSLWWGKDQKIDAEIKSRFGFYLEKGIDSILDKWRKDARGRLALIILIDQFSRNIFRNQAEAYARDNIALDLCLEGLDYGHDRQLRSVERVFFYMPLEHSEVLAYQNKSVALFRSLEDVVDLKLKEKFTGFTDFAEKHRVIIERFGRFPHRNDILQRTSTEEELEFLEKPGSSF